MGSYGAHSLHKTIWLYQVSYGCLHVYVCVLVCAFACAYACARVCVCARIVLYCSNHIITLWLLACAPYFITSMISLCPTICLVYNVAPRLHVHAVLFAFAHVAYSFLAIIHLTFTMLLMEYWMHTHTLSCLIYFVNDVFWYKFCE